MSVSLFFRQGCLLLVLLALAAPPVAAQRPRNAAATYTLPPDQTTPVKLRQPAPERLRAFRQQREFQYVEVKSEQSSWELLWRHFWQWVSDLLETRPGKLVWEYGIYAGLVAALVFVVLKLMQVDITRAFGRSPRPGALAYDVQAEDIHGQDFDALLAAAEAESNYRLAVRLGYLHVLKQLADQNLIRWQPDKTNHDYLFELPAGPLPEAFQELTRQFDYVWYGELDDITPTHYAQARATRLAFQQLLHSGRRAA
ncbi:DUF4129 domain-containing protein [Microvirga sp. STR05]|uniref:DUF4129 domain-containing protein n=1 Tax=Hymenobacter duratus TaxID=2771356 RepID=A0ABR8JHG6_9BACT|nr:DUF4129 domain-containing protein [Hymenobacter duratus]MBD2714835.1 DUF4129 domain-containing protein [Hymenobacter duratus]MBR7949740.1 DUF4129 domain-containing protein [Microvirga sp. STR05]